MDCIEIASVEEYLRGEIEPAERIAFERHLETCARCQQIVKREKRLDDLLRQARPASAPATLLERVMRGLDAPRGFFTFTDRVWMVGLGLVLAAIGSFVGYAGREAVAGISARISQLLAVEKILDWIAPQLSTAPSSWLNQMTAGNPIFLLNFLVAAVILCWGLWQMVKVLRR